MRTTSKLYCLIGSSAMLVGLFAWSQSNRVTTPVDCGSPIADSPTFPVAADGVTGDWPQWGGTSTRNNVPVGTDIPESWDVGSFDRKTGAWNKEKAENVLWVAPVGSQTYGNPVVADGRVYIGTNNSHGYLARYPSEVDLGCLIAFDKQDGSLLWQHSSEKLLTGRVHDWPLQGICCAPLVEGNRLWFVSSRGMVVCCDTEGFHDGEDDGPAKAGWGRLFKESPSLTDGLDAGVLPSPIEALMAEKGVSLSGRVRVTKGQDNEDRWIITLKGTHAAEFAVTRDGETLTLAPWSNEDKKTSGSAIATFPADLTAGLNDGKPSPTLLALISKRGMPISGSTTLSTVAPNTKWSIVGSVNGQSRTFQIRREGPNLSGYKQVTVEDKSEADEIWTYDMMGELTVSQHNMCSCSVTALGDILFVNTSNGVDESHINIPSPDAPSFIAMDKNTGQLLWSDASPGVNILHGQWSSPTVGVLGGVPQVIFGGGDGWVYSFKADKGKDGKPTLLWKFDANPKDSEWILGGRGTRNNIIATPVIYKERVYVAVGQDPEHGEGVGHLWCIDPTKRGDVSPQTVVHVQDRKPVTHRSKESKPFRIIAMSEKDGEVAIDNPNSAVIWHYAQFDQNGDGEFDFEEEMHRSCGTVAIKDDILYIADFSGLLHCLDAMTGKVHWTYDMLAASWGSPLIVDDKVYIGDEDGEVSVFNHSTEAHDPIAEVNMLNSVYSTPIVSDNVMYISNRTHLFAIQGSGVE